MMTTHRAAVLSACLILCCFLYSQAKPSPIPSRPIDFSDLGGKRVMSTPTPQPNTPTASYQLLSAQITMNSKGNTWEVNRVFLVDSTSGHVWEYAPESLDKNGAFHDPGFAKVVVVPQ